MRQVLVRLEEAKEKESTAGLTGERLLAAFKSGQYAHTGQIVAVNRLQSGDLLSQTITIEAMGALERNTAWARRVYKPAVVVRKSFFVMVHGMCSGVFDTSDQATIKAKLETDNSGHHPGLEILGARWVSSVGRLTAQGQKKKYSSLILNVATPEMADRLIQKYLVEGGEMKKVERFDQTATSMQCYNCQEYCHMAKSCRNQIRCAECN